MSADFLATMAASSRARVNQARQLISEAQLEAQALATPRPPALLLSPQGFDVIAEVKLRSPAVGQLSVGDENIAQRVSQYAAAGAAAVSVLTEPERFEGSLGHLRQAAASLVASARSTVPAMRKDFLVDPYQITEARVAGAGGVLIIVRMLTQRELLALIAAAKRWNLFVLIEAFDAEDIARAQELLASAEAQGARLLLGVNSRDLVSLKVVPGRLEELFAALPDSLPRVAESGVGNAEDAARLAACGYEMALIGSSLMTATNPAQLLADMLLAGRAAREQALA